MLVYLRVPHISYLVTLLTMKGEQPYFDNLVTMVINHFLNGMILQVWVPVWPVWNSQIVDFKKPFQLRWRPGGLSQVGLFDLVVLGWVSFTGRKWGDKHGQWTSVYNFCEMIWNDMNSYVKWHGLFFRSTLLAELASFGGGIQVWNSPGRSWSYLWWGMMLVITVDGEIFKSAIFCGGFFGDDDLLRECISNKQVTHAYSMLCWSRIYTNYI